VVFFNDLLDVAPPRLEQFVASDQLAFGRANGSAPNDHVMKWRDPRPSLARGPCVFATHLSDVRVFKTHAVGC